MRGLGGVMARGGQGVAGTRVRPGAGDIERSAGFRWGVRAGFVARGLTYGVIGALALAMAVGAGTDGTAPNQQGALSLIARTPVGGAALVVICAGLLAYALWKLLLGIRGRGPQGGGGTAFKDRVGNLAGAVVYLLFFGVALKTLVGSGGNGSGETRQAAAGVLGWPGGQLIVAIGGAVLVLISVHQIRDAITGGFAEDSKTERMQPEERRVFMTLGRVGISARGLVFGLVGYFLLRTALDFKPSSAVGINGALGRLQHQPLGPWVLGLVALGLITFAAFSWLEAAYRRL